MAVLSVLIVSIAALVATWYSLFTRRKQDKAREVLRWIQSALSGRGHVVGISWTTASTFRVPLRLTCGVFQRAWVTVELQSQQTPVQWLFNKIRGKREVLTFHADLDYPPSFSLHVHNFRWFARSSRKTNVNRSGWTFEHLQPLVISTNPDHRKDVASAMASIRKGDSSEFLNVSFQKCSPHFSATLPLESLAPGSPARTYMLDAMRDLATSSSASLF
ncbi:MAG TPA: hypothetical protein VFB79_10235 [Candidatus Angelobacter sp.]|nr:hypothetical protein [Candidatus Angelobacter sp.]